MKIGRLKVLERIPRYNGGNKTYYRCICDCGKECFKYGYYLSTGRTNSCGCLRIDGRKKGRKAYAFQVGDIIETNAADSFGNMLMTQVIYSMISEVFEGRLL